MAGCARSTGLMQESVTGEANEIDRERSIGEESWISTQPWKSLSERVGSAKRLPRSSAQCLTDVC